MTKRQKIELALSARYDFRYNFITGDVQYREKGEKEFKNHTDYEMNSIIRKIDREDGESVSESMYMSIVKSDFTERYHPLQHYFYKHLPSLNLPASDTYIQALADTVTVQPSERNSWEISLKRWLVASVANALTAKDCQNHNCIVFTGGMGLFKTTWLALLCPPILAPSMIMTGKIDLNLTNKDTFMLLGIKFIINLDDQLRNLMKKDSETMKTLVTHPEVSIRRPFSKFHETVPRIGNFVASINGEEFLAENENRRFLPFRVKAIDINAAKAMNMDLVWNEAFNLWKSNYKYWWEKDELEMAFPDMQSFAYASDELELILEHFDIPTTRADANILLNSSGVMTYLKSINGLTVSTKKIGEALKGLGAIQVKERTGTTVLTKYALIQKNLVSLPITQPFKPPM